MGITTKTGDSGMTCLYGGKRVPKDDLRVELCGEVDELSSFLGLAKALSKAKKQKDFLKTMQQDLYFIAAEMATPAAKTPSLKKRLASVSVKKLDTYIVEQEKNIRPKQSGFVFTGENLASSVYDICRSLTRRLERKAVTAFRKKIFSNGAILVYLNRLSDALYVLARTAK